MRIAFTHNLQTDHSEAQAEFDTPETVASLRRALEALGHTVYPLDVARPVDELVTTLEALKPQLVFNTAEGHTGRFREAFYPALFEQLGLAWTGSDAWVCALTLDKHATKALLADRDVPMAGSILVDREERIDAVDLRFPVICKPNFEGSSKGITQKSVVEDAAALRTLLTEMLPSYPEGILVEEYIEGFDVVVPYVEGSRAETGGVLPAVGYRFDERVTASRRYTLYDYTLKNTDSNAVEVQAPADIPQELAERLQRLSQKVFRALGVRDLGRIDWRIGEDGEPYFLEINALPSLEPGAGIYASGALVGLEEPGGVLKAVLESACRRFGIDYAYSAEADARVTVDEADRTRVAVVYNLKRVKPQASGADDEEAEFDAPDTIAAIAEAISSFGHEVVPLEADSTLLTRIGEADVDVAFNIAEGIRGRGREALVPAVLDLLDIPYTGSDAATLAIALDKALAKRLVREAGLPTADFAVVHGAGDPLPDHLGWPVLVKPVAEGSSKGVGTTSVVRDAATLRERVDGLIERYDQPVLIEAFLPGREFTVGLLGGRSPRLLPVMEVVFKADAGSNPIYGFEQKVVGDDVRFEVPAKLDPDLSARIEAVVLGAWDALGCRDVARVDLRCDADGQPCFIECNPLPGLTPGWSDLCQIATAGGLTYRDLIAEILAPALARLEVIRAERALEATR